jgi:hypothetical protein
VLELPSTRRDATRRMRTSSACLREQRVSRAEEGRDIGPAGQVSGPSQPGVLTAYLFPVAPAPAWRDDACFTPRLCLG